MRIRSLTDRVEPLSLSLTFAWIVGNFSISTAALQDLWRPLVLTLAAAFVGIGAVSALSRGNRPLMVAASSLWLLALTAWFVGALIGLLAVLRVAMDAFRRSRGLPPMRESRARWIARMGNTLGIALSLVAVVSAVASGAIHLNVEPARANSAGGSAPSIYLILLDGYPRADTLEGEFGFRSDRFFGELSSRGFDVSPQSRSNYNTTLLTLSSTLHMRYVESIDGLRGAGSAPQSQARALTAAINNAPVPDMLRAAGYEIIAVPSWYGEAALTGADEVHTSGRMTLFEEQLLRLSTLGNLVLRVNPDIVAAEQRQSVQHAFAKIAELATASADAEPRLVFAHVFSPHAPAIFNADGSPRAAPPCYPMACSFNVTEAAGLGQSFGEYGQALVGQLEYLQGEILTLVDEIVAADPNAVVVLFSDHGARYDRNDRAEQFKTFFAARTPHHDELFPADVSPVNIFPTLFNAYFDAELPLQPYRAWWAEPATPLDMTRVE